MRVFNSKVCKLLTRFEYKLRFTRRNGIFLLLLIKSASIYLEGAHTLTNTYENLRQNVSMINK